MFRDHTVRMIGFERINDSHHMGAINRLEGTEFFSPLDLRRFVREKEVVIENQLVFSQVFAQIIGVLHIIVPDHIFFIILSAPKVLDHECKIPKFQIKIWLWVRSRGKKWSFHFWGYFAHFTVVLHIIVHDHIFFIILSALKVLDRKCKIPKFQIQIWLWVRSRCKK